MMQVTMEADGNPLQMIQLRAKRLDQDIKMWLRQQPAAMEVVLVTSASAVQGVAIGALMETFSADVASVIPTSSPQFNSEAATSLQQAKVLHEP